LARCLIIGCGCRGIELGGELRSAGHAVRGTTRDSRRIEQLEIAGIESVVGDPDRIATLAAAFEHVTVACLLLGSAAGSADQLQALHTSRLQMLLGRMLDTTIRGIVYEANGSVPGDVLEAGARIVQIACEGSRIPYVLLRADSREHGPWLEEASEAAAGLLRAG
jgi:uncharacterized protein YbjT (DUF2867 family)